MDGDRVWQVRPTRDEAWNAYRHAGAWVAQALAAGAERVVFDLADAQALDFSSFALAVERLRRAGVQVGVVNAAPHLEVSLAQMGLLHRAHLGDRR